MPGIAKGSELLVEPDDLSVVRKIQADEPFQNVRDLRGVVLSEDVSYEERFPVLIPAFEEYDDA
ncbi:MAG: hypothetical protein IMF16_04600 [Proteobacteria bacterium]|nr:hypothetical protein [Pseudomonadota bacterium]